MEYETDKGKEKGEYNADDMPTIRIILKSQMRQNLITLKAVQCFILQKAVQRVKMQRHL